VSGDERASHAPGLSDPADPLVEGRMEVLGLMPNSSNYTYLARCRTPDAETLAIYKPRRGEIPLWDFPEGTLHRREVAAYELARSLGWPSVPTTIVRGGPEGRGSAQRFVPFDPEQHFFTLQAERADDFRLIALFDIVANNADRKGGHCLLGEDGTIWAIDHGVCFNEEPKLRTVIWDFIDEPIPEGARADLERVAAALAPGGALRAALEGLLAREEVDATVERLDGLLRAGCFPAPEPGTRPWPWPPV
jgi:uncharacterized repeat protein (TIGR03843 family)